MVTLPIIPFTKHDHLIEFSISNAFYVIIKLKLIFILLPTEQKKHSAVGIKKNDKQRQRFNTFETCSKNVRKKANQNASTVV